MAANYDGLGQKNGLRKGGRDRRKDLCRPPAIQATESPNSD